MNNNRWLVELKIAFCTSREWFRYKMYYFRRNWPSRNTHFFSSYWSECGSENWMWINRSNKYDENAMMTVRSMSVHRKDAESFSMNQEILGSLKHFTDYAWIELNCQSFSTPNVVEMVLLSITFASLNFPRIHLWAKNLFIIFHDAVQQQSKTYSFQLSYTPAVKCSRSTSSGVKLLELILFVHHHTAIWIWINI